MPSSVPLADQWTALAACKGQTDAFFPDQDTSAAVDQAKAICRGCPVREECLEAGLSEPCGIWGGMTAAERRKLRRERQGEAA